MNTGDRIKELRVLNNLTQEELGSKVGVKKAAVQKWESGMTKNLKRSTIKKLSEIFNVSPSYVMAMTSVKQAPSYGVVAENTSEYNAKYKKIPILGSIAAGMPILAEENIEDYFNIDSRIKADFALRIKGDSMIDAGIYQDDVVFIKQQSDLENGDIGAVLIDDSATLKRFYRDNGSIILQAENNAYKPIVLTNGNIKILGKLVAVLNIKER